MLRIGEFGKTAHLYRVYEEGRIVKSTNTRHEAEKIMARIVSLNHECAIVKVF